MKGLPFEAQNIRVTFRRIRESVPRDDGRVLVLRALRHSCVVQLGRSGCSVPQIRAITGHSLKTVERVLERYLPRDDVMAWQAQAKRGLIQDGRHPV